MVRRSPICWFGGKGRLAGRLVQLLPPHRHYVEPFGGGASVLVRKEPAAGVETYNDLDRGLVTLFRVLADPEAYPRFMRRVMALPVSRELYYEYTRTWMEPADPAERAARWFLVARQSFAGMWGKSFGTAVASTTNGMGCSTGRWLGAIRGLPELHRRLLRVQVEHADFRTILERYSGDGYLAYCDPPYVPETRKAGGYDCELTAADHDDLVAILLEYRDCVLLSGYATERYRPLDDAGWRRLDVATTCHAAGRTRASGLQGVGHVKATQQRVESIWLNPLAVRRLPRSIQECAAGIDATLAV